MSRWVYDEVKDKTGQELDMDEWVCVDMSDRIPVAAQQTDIHSCGPYAAVCLELIDSNLLFQQEVWYTQLDMQTRFRYRLLVEIYRGRIDY
jgi:hypothetical protein